MLESKDYITLALGTIGTCLGVLNTIKSSLKERVHLRVTPQASWAAGRGHYLNASAADGLRRSMEKHGLPLITIEVANLSAFAVVIAEIGLRERDLASRSPFYGPLCNEDNKLPARLEPRASATWYAPEHYSAYTFTDNTCVYAETACGKLVRTGGPFMAALKNETREWRKRQEADTRDVFGDRGIKN